MNRSPDTAPPTAHRPLTYPAGPATRSRVQAERGAMAVWAIGVVLVGFVVCAVILNVGAAITRKAATLDIAQQAARAGADQVDLFALRRDGRVRLDPVAARTAAQAFLAAAGAEGSVSASTTRVAVTATTRQPSVLLQDVGVGDFSVSATAYAVPSTG
jgi:hypothetical protein